MSHEIHLMATHMLRPFLLIFLVAWAMFGREAEARSCRHGYIKRISLGVCVSKRSRLARGFYRVSAPRRQPSLQQHVQVERSKKQDRLEEYIPTEDELLPIDKPSVQGSVEVPAPIEVPLPNSLMLRKVPAQPFNWLAPEHLDVP